MGAPSKEKYDTEFIKRTQTLIKDYRGVYTTTLLLNCLLGLIILPNEFKERKGRKFNFLNQEIQNIKEIQDIISKKSFLFNPTKRNKGLYMPDKKSLKNFLKKIRNGAAHQRIEPITENGKWKGVKIEDINGAKNLELEIELTIKELRDFAFFISTKYIEEFEKLNKTLTDNVIH
jgi:hypothetical protein